MFPASARREAWLGQFVQIAEGFSARGIPRATSPEEMAYVAAGLEDAFLLDVEGDVLECGCWTGFSTCCLSHVCKKYARTLYVADSFEGLPDPCGDDIDVEGNHYRRGQFCATRVDLEWSLRDFGERRSVAIHHGWFEQSLRHWYEPLAAIWLDVDLGDSAADALAPTLPHLEQEGVVFSHEALPEFFADGKILDSANSVWRAIRETVPPWFPYTAKHIVNNLGEIRPV